MKVGKFDVPHYTIEIIGVQDASKFGSSEYEIVPVAGIGTNSEGTGSEIVLQSYESAKTATNVRLR